MLSEKNPILGEWYNEILVSSGANYTFPVIFFSLWGEKRENISYQIKKQKSKKKKKLWAVI